MNVKRGVIGEANEAQGWKGPRAPSLLRLAEEIRTSRLKKEIEEIKAKIYAIQPRELAYYTNLFPDSLAPKFKKGLEEAYAKLQVPWKEVDLKVFSYVAEKMILALDGDKRNLWMNLAVLWAFFTRDNYWDSDKTTLDDFEEISWVKEAFLDTVALPEFSQASANSWWKVVWLWSLKHGLRFREMMTART